MIFDKILINGNPGWLIFKYQGSYLHNPWYSENMVTCLILTAAILCNCV